MAKKTTLYFYPWKKNDKEDQTFFLSMEKEWQRRPHSISIHGTRISEEDHSIYIHESRITKEDHALALSLEKEWQRRTHSISIHGTRISKEDHPLFISMGKE